MPIIDCYYYCRDDRTICSECNFYKKIINQENSKAIIEQIIAERTLTQRRDPILPMNRLSDLITFADRPKPVIRACYQWIQVQPESVWCTAKEAMQDYNKWTVMMKFWQIDNLPRFFY